MRTGVLRVALAGLLLAGALRAGATPGNGIRLGGSAGRLHPYLELEGRYDTNVAYAGKAEDAFVLHVRPGITLDSPGEVVAVDLKANADWAQVTGSQSKLSHLYGRSQLALGVNRRGQVGLELADDFERTSSVQVLNLGTAVISNSNTLDLRVPFRPGGGALVTTAAASWRLQTYEAFDKAQLCTGGGPDCDPAVLDKLGYSDVTAGLESRWKFLPRTAALAQGEYFLPQPTSTTYGDDCSGVRGWAGLAGLFGVNVAGTVKGGYATTFGFEKGFNTWLANVEAEWIPLETASAKLGYVHDLGADPGKRSLYSTHRVYADAHALLEGRFTGRLTASWERRRYELVKDTSADLLRLEPAVEVELTRWLRTAAGFVYTKRTSQLPEGTPALPGYSFDKEEVYLRLVGTY